MPASGYLRKTQKDGRRGDAAKLEDVGMHERLAPRENYPLNV
jgi:hypothetical protein